MKEMNQYSSYDNEIEITGLIGVIGSGKSYTASQLVDNGYVEVIIADSVKRLAHDLLNIHIDPKDALKLKDLSTISVSNFPFEIGMRDYYINVGQKLKTFFNNDKLWIQKSLETITEIIKSGHTRIVVSDVRFPIEVSELRNFQLNGYKIKVKFIFCNYKSNRYKLIDSESEMMARHFLSLGYKDKDEVIFKNENHNM